MVEDALSRSPCTQAPGLRLSYVMMLNQHSLLWVVSYWVLIQYRHMIQP